MSEEVFQNYATMDIFACELVRVDRLGCNRRLIFAVPDGTAHKLIGFRRPRVVSVLFATSEHFGHVAARERLKLLIDELNHRVKNTLAAVQSIAMQALPDAPDLPRGDGRSQALLFALRARTMWSREGIGAKYGTRMVRAVWT